LVALYYTLSPPIAKVIAGSEVLRAFVRFWLVPVVAWAALVLWSPILGLGIALVALGLGAWLAFRVFPWIKWAVSGGAIRLSEEGRPSRRGPLWQRLALWGCVLFVLALAGLVEAGQGKRSHAEIRLELVGEVHLPQATWFALIRDQKTGHLGVYKSGEAIFEGGENLPLGKIVEVHDHALVLTLPSGQAVKIPRGARLPGQRGLIFVRSTLIDTIRYQVRFGAATASGGDYSVIGISGGRAILQRDSIAQEDKASAGPLAVKGPPKGQEGAPRAGGPPSLQEGATLAEVVDHIPLAEVEPDTWEVPGRQVMELGNHLEPLLMETLRSATPTFTMAGGVGLRINTSLGSGTLDRRGFKIGYAKMAQRTGLEVGDVIISVNEQPVNSIGGLARIYRELRSNSSLSEVKVVIKRGEEMRALTYRIR
jgi:hypothetical protein